MRLDLLRRSFSRLRPHCMSMIDFRREREALICACGKLAQRLRLFAYAANVPKCGSEHGSGRARRNIHVTGPYSSRKYFSRAFWASSIVRNLNTPCGYCLGAMAHQRAQCRRNRSKFDPRDTGRGALFISSIERNFCTGMRHLHV